MNVIEFVHAVVLGIVEGATEFIPVSSTGHLILAQSLLGLTGRKDAAFAIFIQLGAILAVVWLYRKKLLALALTGYREPESRQLILNLIVGTIPAVVIGLPTADWVEAHFFKPLPVSLALVLGGVAILLVERWARRPSVDTLDRIPLRKAFGVGMIQVLSIVFPGVSRSGATIMGGMALGLSRTAATEFSFFLAIPAMCGASALKLMSVRETLTTGDLPYFAVGFIASFVVALAAIRVLLSFVSRHSFASFAWYRIAIGLGFILFFRHMLTAGL